jgi:hypothetical protein
MTETTTLKILNPRTVRAEVETTVDLGDGTAVKARKEDMATLVFEGRVPMPLLTAVQKMIEMPEGTTDEEKMAALGPDQIGALLVVLRTHALRVVLAPKLTEDDTGDPDTLPVSYLTSAQLMAIWSQTAVVPRFTAPAAARFRAGGDADAADAASDGADVPSQPEPVAGPDLVSG